MKRVVNFRTVWSALALTIFIISEIAVIAVASVWALSGLLNLGAIATYIFAALVGAGALYGMVQVARMAFEAETSPENNL